MLLFKVFGEAIVNVIIQQRALGDKRIDSLLLNLP